MSKRIEQLPFGPGFRQRWGRKFNLAIHLVLAVVLFLLFSGESFAQKNSAAPSDAATVNAKAVIESSKKALESKEVSQQALINFRGQLAELRDTSQAVVSKGSIEGRTIKAQLDALGSPPKEGQSESEEVAGRRAELIEKLAKAEEPVRQANEALQQSQVLIHEFDQRIRDLQAMVLLHRYPTPLLPAVWLTAADELTEYAGSLQRQLKTALREPGEFDRLQGNIPTIVILLVFGLSVLLVGQQMLVHRLERVAAASRLRWYRWSLVGLKSLSRLALPAIGAGALLVMVKLLQTSSPVMNGAISEALPVMAAIVVLAHWLGHTIFSPTNVDERLLSLSDRQAQKGFRLCLGFGLLLALGRLIKKILENYLFAEATISVLAAPLLLCSCLLLWQLGRLLLAGGTKKSDILPPSGSGHEHKTLDSSFLYFLARLIQGAGLIFPLVVLLGFIKLAQEAIFSLTLTVALLGLALLLYNVAVILLQALLQTDRAEETEDSLSLLPVCVICLLVIAFAPLIAMAWGASVADLREAWRLLTHGVQLGEIRLSLDMVMTLVLVFALGLFLTRWLQRLLKVSVLPRTKFDKGAQTAMVTGVGYLGTTLAALIAVSTAGLNLSNLAVVAGALSLGIGFGLQTIVSNFVSGVILLIERPIKEGDWIEVSGYSGIVRKISVRSTRIETLDRHDVVLPNSDLISGTVKNMTLSSKTGRLIIPVGVAYGSDLDKTREILLDAAKSHKALCTQPPPTVLFAGLGESSLDLELRCFLRNIGEILTVKSDLLFTIYAALNREGIAIPFPQRDIHLSEIDRLITAIEGRPKTAPTAE
jgi:small-conductance mechanosensitive channel